MTRHSSERPFMCPYCAKTFKSSLNCKKHIKLHRTEFAIQLMSQQNEINVDNDHNVCKPSLSTDKSTNDLSLERNVSQTEPSLNNVCVNIECNQPSNNQQLEDIPIEQTNNQQIEPNLTPESSLPLPTLIGSQERKGQSYR